MRGLGNAAPLAERLHGLTGRVALGPQGAVSAETLLRQAGAIAERLPPAGALSEVAFSFGQDRLACLAALLATWATGHTAVVPEDATRDNIYPLLRRKENVAFVHDTGVGLGLHAPSLIAEAGRAEPPRWVSMPAQRTALAAYRWSPIGGAQVASWNQAQLVGALSALAERMCLPDDAHVISSLTPTALPGLLLGSLVPLFAGATFETRTPPDADGLARQARARGAHSLIVSPAHARATCRLERGALPPLSAVHCIDEGLDARSIELFATRHNVQVAATTSLPLGEDPPEFVAPLRDALLSAQGVGDAAVSLLAAPDAPGRVLLAVVCGEDRLAGLEALAAGHVPAGLTCELARFPALPRDDNGRLPLWKAALLFGYGRDGRVLESGLQWSEVEVDDPAERRFATRIPTNYAYFEGHYSGYPVLAGAVQLHELVLPCIRRVDPAATHLKRLSGVKFTSTIAPGSAVQVIVSRGPQANSFRFEILSRDTRCSTGLLLFADRTGA